MEISTLGEDLFYLNMEPNNDLRMKLFDSGGFAIGTTFTDTDPGAQNLTVQGSVGIGTTNPSEKLEVVGNITMSGSATHFLKSVGDLHIYADNAKVIEMWTSGSDYLFKSYHDDIRYPDIGTKGMVLGTASTAESILQLYSEAANGDTTLRIDHGNSARGDFYLRSDNYGSTSNRFIIGEVTGGDFLTIMSDNDGSGGGAGYVGIGTASPGVNLDILDAGNDSSIRLLLATGNTTGTLGNIVFGNTNIDNTLAKIQCSQDGATDSARLTFHTEVTGGALTERMRITSDGKVGIWSTVPGGYLSIEGTGNHRGIFVAATGATHYSAIQAEANALTTGSVARFSSNSATTNAKVFS